MAPSSIEVDGDVVRLGREAEAGLEQYELPLPAAVGVKEGINLPRYPTMKGRLASKKVAVGHVDAAASAGGQQLVRLFRPDRAGHRDDDPRSRA